MTKSGKAFAERARQFLWRAASSTTFWGVVGWALLILRYASEVIHPRYGG